MIKIKVIKEEFIKEVIISGHALYADYGKDIVCASVSSIVITTINAIEMFDNHNIIVNEEALSIKVLLSNEIIDKLLNNMLNMLSELANDYPKNIKFI